MAICVKDFSTTSNGREMRERLRQQVIEGEIVRRRRETATSYLGKF